ncbi:AAA family ATPase [Gulosibacter hominis]|uniref:AAA family ATPase n=1 Tax=Gulosibacter hominis TaxID=2770504 RepID=UPI001918B98F|nr:AAA family ATPase [Gulosibacter hominis]
MVNAIDRVRNAIISHGGKITNDQGDRFRATTVCHGGDGQNLSVRQAGDKVLTFCHSQHCAVHEVATAIGLEVRDLYDDRATTRTYVREREDGSPAWVATRDLTRSNGKGFTNTKGQASGPDKRLLYGANRAREAVTAGIPIYVVEGEKDADSVAAVGGVAVTSGGATTAKHSDWSPLYGARCVIVVPDQDKQGEQYERDVVKALTGRVETIEVRRPLEGKDISDHLAFSSLDSLELVTTIKPRRLETVSFDQIEPKRLRWLWSGMLPQSTLSIIAGRGSAGKSTFAAHVAARVSRGELEGDQFNKPGNVLYWESEDPVAEITRPRLEAAGADLARVHHVPGIPTDTAGVYRAPKFPDDIELLEEAITTTNATLVVLSPVMNTVEGEHAKAEQVRRALNPLMALAMRKNIVILGIAHVNKGKTGAGGDLLSGSHAIRDAVRSLYLLAAEDDGTRLMEREKGNYSPDTESKFEFCLEGVSIPVAGDEPANVARVVGFTPCDRSAVDVLRAQGETEDEREERNEVQQWLVDYLLSKPGYEALSMDVRKAGRAAGFTEEQVKNARRRCRVPRIKSERAREFQSGTVWMIDPETVPTQVTQVTQVTGVGGSKGVTRVAETPHGSPESTPHPTDLTDTSGTSDTSGVLDPVRAAALAAVNFAPILPTDKAGEG